MNPEDYCLIASIDQWLKNRPQSQAVKAREAHAKLVLQKYYERTRSKSSHVTVMASRSTDVTDRPPR
jgi:hypothetical protein